MLTACESITNGFYTVATMFKLAFNLKENYSSAFCLYRIFYAQNQTLETNFLDSHRKCT